MPENSPSAEGLESQGERALAKGDFREAALALKQAAIEYRVRAAINKNDMETAQIERSKSRADLDLYRQWVREHAVLEPLPRPDLPRLENGQAVGLLVGITNGTLFQRRYRLNVRFPDQQKRLPDAHGSLVRRLNLLLRGLESALSSRGVGISSPGGSIVRRAGTLLHAMTWPEGRVLMEGHFPWGVLQDPEVRVLMDPIADIAAEFGRRVQEAPVPEEET